jgi:hypothetical protein
LCSQGHRGQVGDVDPNVGVVVNLHDTHTGIGRLGGLHFQHGLVQSFGATAITPTTLGPMQRVAAIAARLVPLD